jgi:hypothetical protein
LAHVHCPISYPCTRNAQEGLEKNQHLSRVWRHFTAQMRDSQAVFIHQLCRFRDYETQQAQLNETGPTGLVFSRPKKGRWRGVPWPDVFLYTLWYKRKTCAGCLPIEPLLLFETGKYLHSDPRFRSDKYQCTSTPSYFVANKMSTDIQVSSFCGWRRAFTELIWRT